MAQPNQFTLPAISRFLVGLVTQRNPIDTPFTLQGLNVVQHHDALYAGSNMEISNNNTLCVVPVLANIPQVHILLIR